MQPELKEKPPNPPLRPPSLQRQLTLGIGAGLLFLLVFFLIAGPSWKALEVFVLRELKPDMALAQAYDRLLTEWVRSYKAIPESPEQLLQQAGEPLNGDSLASCSRRIDQAIDLVAGSRSRERYHEVTASIASYTGTVRNLERVLDQRRRLNREESRRLAVISKTLAGRAQELTQGFKIMVEDFLNLMKSTEFLDRQAVASEFVLKISRIEKDLIIVQNDLNSYIRASGEVTKDLDANETAERINKRLKAVLSLLDRSMAENLSAAQRRALDRIKRNLMDLRSAFNEVRDQSDKSDSEVLELDEEIARLRLTLKQIYHRGVELVFVEAENLKVQLEMRATELAGRSHRAYLISMAFLGLGLVLGLGVLIFYPRRISGDLKRLSDQVGQYEIGDALEAYPKGGTGEIRDLNMAFRELADRLSGQVDVISRYTKAIEGMGEVFATLQQHSETRSAGDAALHEAAYQALSQLAVIPGLGMAKVMVRRWIGGSVSLVRLGEEFSAVEFRESSEFSEYQKAQVPVPDTLPGNSDLWEMIPPEEGVSGWLLNDWDAPEGRTQRWEGQRELINNRNFLQRNMVIPVIGDHQLLERRKYEKGLRGAVFGVKIPWLGETLVEKHGGAKEKPVQERDFVPNQNGMIGILVMYFPDRETRISEQERLFAQIIGGQIAELIHTHRMIIQQKELQKLKYHLQMAAEIQEHLLPMKSRIPRHPSVEISLVCQPAGDVGGDYYDFPFPPASEKRSATEVPPEHIHLIIADASGKNIPAAILMTILKTAVASMDIGTMRPHEVLNEANRIINKCITSDRFITALYLILHTATGIVEIASAGHYLPLRISPKGQEPRFGELGARSLMPLGIMEDIQYATDRFQLNPGDSLFLYTDGVIEARNSQLKEYGMDRLKKFLLREHPSDPGTELLAEIEAFREEAPQHDDITAVLVKWSGGSHERKPQQQSEPGNPGQIILGQNVVKVPEVSGHDSSVRKAHSAPDRSRRTGKPDSGPRVRRGS